MLDPAVAEVLARVAADPARPPTHLSGPVESRRWAVRSRTRWLSGEPDLDVVRATLDVTAADGFRVGCRVYRPTSLDLGSQIDELILFAHGGGWVTGDLETHDALCARLSRLAGCLVVAVDYRLAPEHPFPQPLEDVAAVADHVLAGGLASWSGKNLFLAGDSAGGNLAAVLAQRLRGTPALRGQLLFYPILDHSVERVSYDRYGTGFTLDAAEMAWFWDQYEPDPGRRGDPAHSPLRAPTLAGLVPALIVAAENDVLVDEGHEYATRLRAAGTRCVEIDCPGMVHGFLRMTAVVPAGLQVLAECAAFIRELAGG